MVNPYLYPNLRLMHFSDYYFLVEENETNINANLIHFNPLENSDPQSFQERCESCQRISCAHVAVA